MNELTTYIVYGRRRTGLDQHGRLIVAGVHAEGLRSFDEAVSFAIKQYVKYGNAVECVVVELENGRDRNGERRVVHRIGEGKAWWE